MQTNNITSTKVNNQTQTSLNKQIDKKDSKLASHLEKQ